MFLQEPKTTEATDFLEKDRAANGYVMNLERAWAWRPDVAESFVALRQQLMEGSTLAPREFAILVCATAQALGDSCCALAWGARLAAMGGPSLAADILCGRDAPTLTVREAALRRWAGQVVRAPNHSTSPQVEALRAAGLAEKEILEATVFVAFRLAFSTVNDALGAQPDPELCAAAPAEVRAAVNYGRTPA